MDVVCLRYIAPTVSVTTPVRYQYVTVIVLLLCLPHGFSMSSLYRSYCVRYNTSTVQVYNRQYVVCYSLPYGGSTSYVTVYRKVAVRLV